MFYVLSFKSKTQWVSWSRNRIIFPEQPSSLFLTDILQNSQQAAKLAVGLSPRVIAQVHKSPKKHIL
jgi:hypothetical protein